MEKIVVKTGIDELTGLETQVEFNTLNFGQPMMVPGIMTSVNITAKRQWLKKDGVTLHNEEAMQLTTKPDDSEEVKAKKEAAISIFETALKSPLTKLVTALL